MYFPSPKEETFGDFLDSELLFIEKSMMMVTNESPRLSQHEKQISIDPVSFFKDSTTSAYPKLDFSPPKLSSKEKFVTASLPNSATSSPRFISKKKCKNQPDPPPPHQSVALSRLTELKEKHSLRKSKSCGEGRSTSPSEDFDMWTPKKIIYHETIDQPYEEKVVIELPKFAYDPKKHIEPCFEDDDKVKCGALCLFLGKAKPVKNRKPAEKMLENVISRRVSLEKFECGSWTSSALALENGEKSGDLRNLFFELPMELIENGVNDADSPVKSAFVFENNNKDLKGVLKRGESRRKSHESTRHVRFSTSSPPGSEPTSPTMCVTPRLRKARDDFNAFLQAQSA